MNLRLISNSFTLLVAAAAFTFVPAISGAQSGGAANMPTGKQFIMTAANVNLSEIELGKLAEHKGNNQAIKDFGKRMVEDHSKLETQLQQLAKREGVTIPARPGAAVASLRQKLSADSGSEFDQAYINHMLSGHKQAVNTFENEIETGRNAAFKAYAENALPVIQDHIRIAEDVAGKMGLAGSDGLEVPSKAIHATT